MSIEAADVRKITESIWSATFGLEIAALPEIPPDRGEPVLTAFVLIAGAWDGALMIQCGAALARRCGAIMFDLSLETISADEINDALGELANMAGGNLKGLVPSPTTLSLPAVVEGRDHSVKVPGSHVLQRLAFASEGGEVLVSILERNPTISEGAT